MHYAPLLRCGAALWLVAAAACTPRGPQPARAPGPAAETKSPPSASEQKDFDLLPEAFPKMPVAPIQFALTRGEAEAVRKKIWECWSVAKGDLTASHNPEFRVYMNPDGTARASTLLNPQHANEPGFSDLALRARQALADPKCQPLPFPPAKYEAWKTFTITFAS